MEPQKPPHGPRHSPTLSLGQDRELHDARPTVPRHCRRQLRLLGRCAEVARGERLLNSEIYRVQSRSTPHSQCLCQHANQQCGQHRHAGWHARTQLHLAPGSNNQWDHQHRPHASTQGGVHHQRQASKSPSCKIKKAWLDDSNSSGATAHHSEASPQLPSVCPD